ncbi:hypothetical protein CBR65_00370 [Cellvibrio sp. PSBB006]|jgi:hypothetical protein|nr:hypothetical protein CBR65_00370 [Cellvibrio sp. PSBB006]
MKKTLLLLHLVLIVPFAFACDETCMRDKVMAEHDIKFPAYLDSKYCKTTSVDFLVNSRKSLQKYREERLGSGHRGGIKNIRNFIEQRKEWLQECDKYLEMTKQGRVFRTDETTEEIFTSMDSLSKELYSLIYRPKNAAEDTHQLTELAGQKFELMFRLMDAHRTDLQLRGLL